MKHTNCPLFSQVAYQLSILFHWNFKNLQRKNRDGSGARGQGGGGRLCLFCLHLTSPIFIMIKYNKEQINHILINLPKSGTSSSFVPLSRKNTCIIRTKIGLFSIKTPKWIRYPSINIYLISCFSMSI